MRGTLPPKEQCQQVIASGVVLALIAAASGLGSPLPRRLAGVFGRAPSPPPPAAPMAYWHCRVIVDLANVRTGPGANNPLVVQISRNTVCACDEERAGWYGIRLADGRRGFVRKDLMQRTFY